MPWRPCTTGSGVVRGTVEALAPEMEEASVVDQCFRLFGACWQFPPRREPVLIFEPRRRRVRSTVKLPYDPHRRPSPTEQKPILVRLKERARGLPIRAHRDFKHAAVNLFECLG